MMGHMTNDTKLKGVIIKGHENNPFVRDISKTQGTNNIVR